MIFAVLVNKIIARDFNWHLNLSSVYSWFREFRRGRDHLHDEKCVGRLTTAFTDSNIDIVRLLIETDRKITCQFIRALLGIGMSQVQNLFMCI